MFELELTTDEIVRWCLPGVEADSSTTEGAMRQCTELPGEDLNPHNKSQNLACYHYTTGNGLSFTIDDSSVFLKNI